MKKILFSGIQPSGTIHIGNYLGALRHWIQLQEKYESIFCVVDLHAIAVPQDPKILKENILNTAKMLMALGIDPSASTLFVQSAVPAHTQLYWALNTITKVSELELMTQYKDKHATRGNKGAHAGLLNYPALMAADILLYQTNVVPVGEDQTQHLELARQLARRFNNSYKKTFTEPSPYIHASGARIMGLDNPNKKMSKSAESQKNYIALTDDATTIKKKIGSATTDSLNQVIYNPQQQPGISNLLTILENVSNTPLKDLQEKYNGVPYSTFKQEMAEAVIDTLTPVQKRYQKISNATVTATLKKGAAKADALAQKTLQSAYKAMGLA
jgi:tryptophanyl-tRNA synthetase